ncbi:farnesol dehydrogenase-like [Chrysoperla carnea]|uniref:farnesol dehydrogenase-like n=1 Tax=Chrysoperla carnea TaxID=189513 RepID=UPI001D06E332|nr:farnesol dehydrogenase-like [Chrysoperla carnea]
MDRWTGKVALVTGASSGIGAAISIELVKYGIVVIGFARRLDRLQKLEKELSNEKGKFVPLQGDISKEQSIINAFKWIQVNYSGVDILVNNSGILRNSNLTDGKTDDWKAIFDVNVIGLCIATREACKSMKERDVNGHIININSLSGHRIPASVEDTNVYPASKYAVTAITETLRRELLHQKTKIKVTSISPGLVKTEIAEAGNSQALTERMASVRPLDPEDIASAVIFTLSTPPHALVEEIRIRPLEQPI